MPRAAAAGIRKGRAGRELGLVVPSVPESLELQSCSLSIAERGEMAAFFAVQAAAGTDSMMAADDNMADEPGTIHLENCLLRGQATVLRVYDGEPLNFSWENGLAITGDRFLVVSGAPIAPRHSHHLQLSLEHVTAVVGRGLFARSPAVSRRRICAIRKLSAVTAFCWPWGPVRW